MFRARMCDTSTRQKGREKTREAGKGCREPLGTESMAMSIAEQWLTRGPSHVALLVVCAVFTQQNRAAGTSAQADFVLTVRS